MKSQEMLRKEFESGTFPYLDSLWRMSFCLTRNESKAAELVQQSYLKSFDKWKQASARLDYKKLLLKSLAEIYLLGLPGNEGTRTSSIDNSVEHSNTEEESFSHISAPLFSFE